MSIDALNPNNVNKELFVREINHEISRHNFKTNLKIYTIATLIFASAVYFGFLLEPLTNCGVRMIAAHFITLKMGPLSCIISKIGFVLSRLSFIFTSTAAYLYLRNKFVDIIEKDNQEKIGDLSKRVKGYLNDLNISGEIKIDEELKEIRISNEYKITLPQSISNRIAYLKIENITPVTT